MATGRDRKTRRPREASRRVLLGRTEGMLREVLGEPEVPEAVADILVAEAVPGPHGGNRGKREKVRQEILRRLARLPGEIVQRKATISIECILYAVYDAWTHAYGYKHLSPVSRQRGTVSDIEDPGGDGDCNFDIRDIDPVRSHDGTTFTTPHCGITPCDRRRLADVIQELRRRWNQPKGPDNVAELDGMLTWDLSRCGAKADWWENHPVQDARFVSGMGPQVCPRRTGCRQPVRRNGTGDVLG